MHQTPRPLAGFNGPTSKGRGGQGREEQERGRGGGKERGGRRGRKRRGEGIIVLEDCQLRTLDPPLFCIIN